jgi:hypothetical protein
MHPVALHANLDPHQFDPENSYLNLALSCIPLFGYLTSCVQKNALIEQLNHANTPEQSHQISLILMKYKLADKIRNVATAALLLVKMKFDSLDPSLKDRSAELIKADNFPIYHL